MKVNWLHLFGMVYGTSVGCCELGNELSYPTEEGNLLTSWANTRFQTRTWFMWLISFYEKLKAIFEKQSFYWAFLEMLTHEIFWVMRHQKVHYCTHKSPSLDLISAAELCETFWTTLLSSDIRRHDICLLDMNVSFKSCLHLQGRFRERWYISIKAHGITSQQVITMCTADIICQYQRPYTATVELTRINP